MNTEISWITHIGNLSTDGVFVYDTQAKEFYYINSTLLLLMGFSLLDKPDGKAVFERIIPEDLHYLQTAFVKLLQNSVVENVEFRINADEVKTVCCSAYLNGQSIVGFVQDLTRIREHETYITTYGAKKDAILEMVSHNLSGPLNMSHHILTSLEKVTREYENEDVNKHLELIRESMNHCIDVINDLLIEEHLTSESVFTRKTRFNIIERVTATLDRLRKSFPEKEFHLSTTADPIFLNSDDVKFFQIFHNLVLNSVKFTPDDGRIEILIDINAESVFIIVRDNGIGIPDSLKPFIFQKYSPASRPGLRNERSIGMGLYITKKLTELLGGTVTFSSMENVGTSFTLQFPLE